MKILILGNGFDLDHNLPTGYKDFLVFCNCVLNMDREDALYGENLKESQRSYLDILSKNEEQKNIFISLIKENRLLRYFNKKTQVSGENWIDFEKEIDVIVREFKGLEDCFLQSSQYNYCAEPGHKVEQILQYMGYDNVGKNGWGRFELDLIHNELCRSLDSFSKALEYYIEYFINETTIEGVAPDILEFDADRILTFNYSNTYERIYGGVRLGESVDHVHGVASKDCINRSNIILGISSEDDVFENSYVEFEKYFQRITKKTGSEYKKWLERRLGKTEKIEVVFFGRSLDSTDSDIIKDLICNDKTIITIFYYNDDAYKQMVANLISIIGKGKLIEFVSGGKPKIRFALQQEHQKNTTGGVEISRDIKDMYRLYLFSNEYIETLFAKIKDRIKSKDVTYFSSQRNAISLFDAMETYNIKIASKDDFLEICRLLKYEKNKNGSLKSFRAEEWYGYCDWEGEIYCSVDTNWLIDRVNLENQQRNQQEEENEFYKKIKNAETSEEIKKILIEVFHEPNPSKEYWAELGRIIGFMWEDTRFQEALDLIKQEGESIFIKLKIMHFLDMYYEHCYEIGCMRELMEVGNS